MRFRHAKNSQVFDFDAGPSLYHPDGRNRTLFASYDSIAEGAVSNLTSDGRWHPLDLRHLGQGSWFWLGKGPDGGSRFWHSWYHYDFHFFAHHKGSGHDCVVYVGGWTDPLGPGQPVA